MQHPIRIFRNYLLPLAIVMPMLWLMVGCFYLPWFETPAQRRPNARAIVGPPESNREIRPGFVTRAQVHAILGRPDLVGVNNTAEGYFVRTNQGLWVAPLCFSAAPAPGRTYAVRLIYDAHDRLTSYEWADDDISEPRALGKLNQTGPKMRQLDSDKNRSWGVDPQWPF